LKTNKKKATDKSRKDVAPAQLAASGVLTQAGHVAAMAGVNCRVAHPIAMLHLATRHHARVDKNLAIWFR